MDVFPHPSVAVNVLVCERAQPSLSTFASLEVTVDEPHASVDDAVPNAALISDADGLQPNVNVVPPVITSGGVISFTYIV